MPWKPAEPGEVPTLGYYVIDWMQEMLAAPDRADYEPFVPYLEQEDFILRYYEINPITGKRRRRRGVISRPRGWGKSPILGALAIVEALADVVPDGWDADGQPIGKPWSAVRTPRVGVLAVSESQTANTWNPMLEMLQGPVLDEYPGVEPLDTFVNLPKGKIEPWTSAARSIKGAPFVFAVMDQTEEWVKSNGGLNLFQKVKNNTAKIGGSFIESPNAFIPGDGSVAENSAAFWASIQEGRALDDGLYYDHREAPGDTDMWERESIELGLRIAYGDSSGHPDGCVIHEPPCPPGHVDLDHLIGTIWDPNSDVQESRSDFLNQITHAGNSWLAGPEWNACGPKRGDEPRIIDPREPITIGFDGSRSRTRGKTDATALVGCTVADGHVFLIAAWEHPDHVEKWQVPTDEVDTKIAETFAAHNVVGFYADPAYWESYVADWEAKYGKKLKVGRKDHPIQFWMGGGRTGIVAQALKQFHTAVVQEEMTHNGSSVLTRHILNARKVVRSGTVQIGKKHPESEDKIDAAVAAVLAWRARLDAVAKGLGKTTKPAIPRRIR
ncbi:MAG TPA: terminase TerL endonuclease subunit [Nocardioides sp.]